MLDRRSCLIVEWDCTDKTPQLDDRSVLEEHRYDALGRRVLLHSRQAAYCPQAVCRSNLVRTVWDGDQVLHEISAPVSGVGVEMDVQYTPEPTFGPKRYGRVMYVHGGGIDYPVAVVRSAYSEALPSAGWVYPFANHKGQFDRGYGQGTCTVVEGRSPYLTEPIGEQPTSSDPVTGQRSDEGPMTVCMEIDWPGRMSFSSGYRRPMWGTVSPWMGSLVYHGRDLSGQMYRRNRFYDPKTARFTQEDPIGIAGGLNVYGYANGDPITYSDPYGLSADTTFAGANNGAVARAAWHRLRAEAVEASASQNNLRAASGIVMLGIMQRMENSSEMYIIDIDDQGRDWRAFAQGSEDCPGDNVCTIQLDHTQISNESMSVRLGHEIGGVFLGRRYGMGHNRGAMIGENAVRMIMGCAFRGGHNPFDFPSPPC